MKQRLVLFFFLAASLPLLAADQRPDQPVASLRSATGEVMVRHGQEWQRVVNPPADLFNGDKVATDRGRAEVYFLADGSTLTLDVGTNLTVHGPEQTSAGTMLRRVEIFVGDVWFDMKKSLNLKTELVTPTAVGGLRGTQGLVHVESDAQSEFTLQEGELEVNHRAPGPGGRQQAVVLHPGEVVRAERGKTLKPERARRLPPRPDVKEAAEKLPRPRGNTRALVHESQRPPAFQHLPPAPAGSAARVEPRKPESTHEAEETKTEKKETGKKPKKTKSATPPRRHLRK